MNKGKTAKETVDEALGKKRVLGEGIDGSAIDGAALLDEVHKFLVARFNQFERI
jgi:hypothetical protein